MNRTLTHLHAITDHLATFELDEPASIDITRHDSGIWVQLTRHDLPGIAGALLAWADTLTVDGLEVWRPPNGDAVHIDLYGHLPELERIRVYGATPQARALFPDLQPGGRLTASLTVLRAWANEDTEQGAAA